MTVILSPSFALGVSNKLNNGTVFSFARASSSRHTTEAALGKNSSLCSSLPVNEAKGLLLSILPARGLLAHTLKSGSTNSVNSIGVWLSTASY